MTRPVLIVEDDSEVRAALHGALVEAGLRVEVAEDGVDALVRLEGCALPFAILLDLRMPRLGGEAFLKALRSDGRFDAVPVITMTAGVGRPGEAEVVAHLRKPFDLQDLLDIVLSLRDAQAA